jgi:hypothetical protein
MCLNVMQTGHIIKTKQPFKIDKLSMSAKNTKIWLLQMIFRVSVNNFYDLYWSSTSNRFLREKKYILIFTSFKFVINIIIILFNLKLSIYISRRKMCNSIDWLFTCIRLHVHQHKRKIDGGSTITSQAVPLSIYNV